MGDIIVVQYVCTWVSEEKGEIGYRRMRKFTPSPIIDNTVHTYDSLLYKPYYARSLVENRQHREP
jgi:hypothetical protein